MKTRLRILHLEDNANDVELIQRALEKAGLAPEVKVAQTGAEFLASVEGERFDVILSDNRVPGFEGATALQLARDKQPGVPFIFVSGFADNEQAREKLRDSGAADCVPKSQLQRLADAILKVLRSHRAQPGREPSDS